MKEVKKCSISGIFFSLEIDAYQALGSYLDSLKTKYQSQAEGSEVIADIEARIAEIILSKQDNTQVVTLDTINDIIAQLGSADEISDESADAKADADSKRNTTSGRFAKRLYRNPSGARIGGVCAGLGKYFGVDPVWLRLAILAPLVVVFIGELAHIDLYLSWFTDIFQGIFYILVILYLILWAVVPTARNARQRLEMEGEPVTLDTLQRENNRRTIPRDPQTLASRIVTLVGQITLIFLKVVFAMLIAGMVIFALLPLLALFGVTTVPEMFFPQLTSTHSGWFSIIMMIMFVTIPIATVIYIISSLVESKRVSIVNLIIAFVLWIMVSIVLFFTTVSSFNSRPAEFMMRHLNNCDIKIEESVDSTTNSQIKSIRIAVPQQSSTDSTTHISTKNTNIHIVDYDD